MAEISNKPWGQFADSDYPDADDYCRAALIDENEDGKPKTRAACKLPVREPKGGPLNRNGIHAAAMRLAGGGGGVDAPAAAKAKAARALVGYYRLLGEDPPDSIRRMVR